MYIPLVALTKHRYHRKKARGPWSVSGFSVRVVLIWRRLRESADGTYLAYFPFALWIEVTK